MLRALDGSKAAPATDVYVYLEQVKPRRKAAPKPDDKVLIAGDVLVSQVVPTLQDGFIKNWMRTLDEILRLDVAHVVPGHGDLMTLRDVTAFRGAMLRFYSGVKEGFENGQSEVEIRKSLDLSAWEKLERSYVIGNSVLAQMATCNSVLYLFSVGGNRKGSRHGQQS